ncbi:hypothetical protein [Halocynthiibacter styelae]|uniref:Uncharacterized protein n=1 Tax=Halocynthiibacter styelae TaxID=2761955 RepID=A0A8J7LLQ5_9RHOB|nr:hypothetical protein [Paenihalocynthiibacter styelae]MBI1494919.1 hypothetical protein [Paenihalocynthiibacter styelae]
MKTLITISRLYKATAAGRCRLALGGRQVSAVKAGDCVDVIEYLTCGNTTPFDTKGDSHV